MATADSSAAMKTITVEGCLRTVIDRSAGAHEDALIPRLDQAAELMNLFIDDIFSGGDLEAMERKKLTAIQHTLGVHIEQLILEARAVAIDMFDEEREVCQRETRSASG